MKVFDGHDLDASAAPGPVPFHRPTSTARDRSYVCDALDRAARGEQRYYTRRCERVLERALGIRTVMLTTSCTHALEMAALLLDLGPGDEVIIPSFTFVSCANAIALRGARPVFADIRGDSLTLDPNCAEALVTPRTRAIMMVNYAGIAPDAERFADMAARRNIVLVEDNAQGLFASQGGQRLGTYGALATVSFDATKNVTCGRGGALLLNDSSYTERAEAVREMGTDRSQFSRGNVDQYTWRDIGSNYILADVLAAQLLAQLEERDAIARSRQRLWDRYATHLAHWANESGVRLPYVPPGAEQPYHAFHLLMPNGAARDAFIERLGADGVEAVTHYTPLHRSSAAVERGLTASCPVTDRVCSTLVRLPLYTSMTVAEQDRVIGAVLRTRP
ncbi:MAG: dTDP-4-amino-4,6-dideoxygalactose transaminase [Candidatus Eremiobacteraeota bacterium]|nr:dTDP-4-amino-4,6-dideoxygalactose transaminase [Candidatus Eremiobacteraeota bacterium]